MSIEKLIIVSNKGIITFIVSFLLLVSLSFNLITVKEDYILKIDEPVHFEEGVNRYLKIPVTFSNNTNDTLKYLTWTCAPLCSLYLIDNKAFNWLDSVTCISNVPRILLLSPKQRRKDTLLFKFNKTYKLPLRYRIGFYLVKNDGNNLIYFMTGKSVKSSIIWSKTIILK